ncbi:CHAT domain-containing protein [Suillus clintonianus]|uniref:CHAT domain-containing protein n=1 Tax=Suillus clintonianus TaxID=1904413 RepID=UPI001B879B20|nr:CHAT domain-containing protein [Suillus clintonianus]KAG2124885.1 CHAT domain-containing protein [Suillus clintonianus]
MACNVEECRADFQSCPPDHYHHVTFVQLVSPSGFDGVINLLRAALLLHPPGHPHRSSFLNNLAVFLEKRFEQRGILSDLDEAIELNRAALLLHPPGHSHRFSSLNNLADCLQNRFEQQGVLSDLDEAIKLHRAALLLRPPSHPLRSSSLNNLSNNLQRRFEQQGALSDLDEAIELNRAALFLRPPGHSHRSSSLNNLACCLKNKFQQRAIELHRDALLLEPPGHSYRSLFQQRGAPSDLDEAVELYRSALLVLCLRDRFQQRGVPSDLDEAIELHRAALLLHPPGHRHRSMSLINLALTLLDRFQQQGILSDLDEAYGLFGQLSSQSHAASRRDLTATRSWATSAEETNHGFASVAYENAMNLLDQHVTLLSSSSRNFDVVRIATSSLAMDAFSCSVRHGALITAVELMERGRAVFWAQLARFRLPLNELSLSGDTGAALAEEFKQLSFRLRSAFDQSAEDQSPKIQQLTMQWDDIVSRIRMLPDFSRFLRPPLFYDLQKAADEGPVIIVNASQYGCDASIVLSVQDPVHVPINITRTEVTELSSEFQSLAEQFGCSNYQHKLVGILRKLWHCIVDPVVQALRASKFTLLPLHAAGPYEKNRDNLSDIYISSYTPTLATLVWARQRVSQDTSTQHFVAIGQAKPEKGKELRCVSPELAVVAQRLAPVVSFTSLDDSNATVQGVLDALNHNQWLHLACHGMPNRAKPFESSFVMRDGPLMIKDIIRSNWQNPEFAFLSACHTTVGDKKSLDESIHLAAAMQFSGFRSVIGSMWSVDDEVARQVVSAFYHNMVDGSRRLDCTHAAIALHKAVKSLRKKISLEQQIVFVHIGV